jgi:hypothetical protein
MRKVVDSNFLQTPDLRTYLASSESNEVVLIDYAAMEAYKGDALKSIYKSMEVLSAFPRQVVVLKSTGNVSDLRGRSKGLQRRMIDRDQTEGFKHYCEMLERGKRGDRSVEKAILAHSKAANAHMDRVMADVADLPAVFADISDDFTADELAIFRKRMPYSNELFDKLVKSTMTLAATLFKKQANAKWPPLHELANTYPFRFALCAYLLFERWIADGRPKMIKAAKLRNDVIDMSFATYGTFFDGLLTADRKLGEIYRDAASLLRIIEAEFAKPGA